MATQDSDQEEKYTRILITLIKGGTKLTCRFFEKRVAELTPADHATSPWTIYEFLLANKDNINKCKQDTGRNNKKLLFPGAPDKIQHTTWDFALFCFLLHELCDLSSAQRLDIEIIIKIRHKLAHATSPTLPDHRYNVYKQRIEVVFGRLLKEIGGADETFIKDIKQILELLNGAPLKLKDVIQEIHKAKLDNKKDMEIMARHMQRLETKVDMILDHMKIDRSKVKVADINVEITPTNCDNTTRASASSLMVTKMQLAVNTNPTSEQTPIVNDPDAEVDQAIGGIRENLESSGKHIVDVDYKCVMLTLRCHSLNILLALYNDSITGRLYQIFRPLEVALNQIIGFENVRLRVEIDEEELYTAIGNYVDVLEEFIMSPQVSEYLMQLEQDSQTEPAADTDVTQELLDHTPYGCSRDVASGKVSDWTNIEKVSVKEEFCKSQRSSEYLMELDKDSQTQPETDIGITPRSENIHNISRVQVHEPDGNITANTESANIDIFEPDNYAGLEVFKRPMCLVRISDDGQFEVDENILMQFRKIELPIVVVAVVGLCRTGKSYLMNCLAGQPGGFPLGNTVEAKTKGILAWCKMHPVKLDTVILMLDSQGLGDIRKGNVSIDCKICTILALLCNVFVYNMMSALNRNFVEDLTFVSEIAKQIRERDTNITGEVENTEETSPTLVICLRDFCLLLEKSGKAVNANEYLEDSLRSKPGTDDRTQRYNQTRESIRKFFPKRKCFTFDRPGNVRTLKQLETVSLKEVSAKFYEDVLQFKSFVHECTPMVRSESRPINGQAFALLVSTYLDAIKAGEVPNIDDAVTAVTNMENENMVNAAIEDFRCSIERIQLPVLKPKEFEDIYNELKQVSLSHFRQGMVKVSAIHKTRAIDEVEIIWKAKSDENRALVRNYYQESLKNMYDRTVGKNLASKKYSTDGGNESYKRDMNAMIVNYLLETEGSWDNEIKYVLTVFLEHESANEREVERMSEDRRKDKLFKVNEALKRIDNDLKNILETVTKHTWSYFKKTEADIHDYLQKQENMMHELQTAIRTNDAILRTLKEENQKLKEECEYLFEQARQEVDLLNLKLEG